MHGTFTASDIDENSPVRTEILQKLGGLPPIEALVQVHNEFASSNMGGCRAIRTQVLASLEGYQALEFLLGIPGELKELDRKWYTDQTTQIIDSLGGSQKTEFLLKIFEDSEVADRGGYIDVREQIFGKLTKDEKLAYIDEIKQEHLDVLTDSEVYYLCINSRNPADNPTPQNSRDGELSDRLQKLLTKFEIDDSDPSYSALFRFLDEHGFGLNDNFSNEDINRSLGFSVGYGHIRKIPYPQYKKGKKAENHLHYLNDGEIPKQLKPCIDAVLEFLLLRNPSLYKGNPRITTKKAIRIIMEKDIMEKDIANNVRNATSYAVATLTYLSNRGPLREQKLNGQKVPAYILTRAPYEFVERKQIVSYCLQKFLRTLMALKPQYRKK
ncbi:hypothetical protein CMO93_01240 [Candidatus Woesearchaeota archaeon]|nr:hypothetical protein [Candidatus Woesearchaeota archaeon]